MILDLAQINWLAVAAAAVASFLIGGIWYAALFGRAWTETYGFSEEQQRELAERQVVNLLIALLADVITAIVFAALLTSVAASTAMTGLLLGLLAWLGFSGAPNLATHVMSGRPMMGFVIDSGKHLASFALIGLILGAWR